MKHSMRAIAVTTALVGVSFASSHLCTAYLLEAHAFLKYRHTSFCS